MWVPVGRDANGAFSGTKHNFNPPPDGLAWMVCEFGDYVITPISREWCVIVVHDKLQTSQAVEWTGVVHNIHRVYDAEDGCALWRVNDGDPPFARWLNIWEGPFPEGTPLIGISKGTTQWPQLNWGMSTSYECPPEQVYWSYDATKPDTFKDDAGDSGSLIAAYNSTKQEWQVAAIVEAPGTAQQTLQTYLPTIKRVLGGGYIPYPPPELEMLEPEIIAYLDARVGLYMQQTDARLAALQARVDSGQTVPVTPIAKPSFVKADTSTSGSWQGVYGGAGFSMAGQTPQLPSFAVIQPANAAVYVWAPTTLEQRAPAKFGTSDRMAACWYSFLNTSIDTSFTLGVVVTDGRPHRVAFYMLDWDGAGVGARKQTVEMIDASGVKVLDVQTISDFKYGVYLVYDVVGAVQFRFTNLVKGANAVVSGVFFD